MPLIVKTAVQPASEPVTLDEAKLHLRVDFADDDALIARNISAARRACEVIGKIACVNTTFDLVDDAFPFTGGYLNRQVRQFYGQFSGGQGAVAPGAMAMNAGVISFPRAPLQSVVSITYLDANGASVVMSPSSYVVTTGSPGRLAVAYGQMWPTTLPQIGAVTIRFVAGYGADASTVPANVKQAVLLYLGFLYENREPAPLDLQAIGALLGVEEWGGYA